MPGAVIVFGASRGLGRAISVAAAEQGFAVVLACRRQADGEPTVRDLLARGKRAMAAQVDVTDHAAVAAVVSLANSFGSGLAGVVNNAGIIGPLATIETGDPADWGRAIAVNLTGAYHCTRAALPLLAKGGVIINLSSGAAHATGPGLSAYCASKAGLAMLTRSTHAEYGDRLRVYGVQPGMVDTDMQAQIREAAIGAPSRVPRGDLSDVEPPARAVAWLLKTAPQDLSGTEVDLESVALRRRIGRSTATK